MALGVRDRLLCAGVSLMLGLIGICVCEAAPMAVTCPTVRDTLKNLAGKIPKFVEGGTECATLIITDRKFSDPFNVKFVDLETDKEPTGESGGTSDFITFETIGAFATICFSSDAAIGQCPPVGGPTTPHFEDPKKGGTFGNDFLDKDKRLDFRVTIFSDGPSGANGAESDTISITTPEPATYLLFGTGLFAYGLHRRKRGGDAGGSRVGIPEYRSHHTISDRMM